MQILEDLAFQRDEQGNLLPERTCSLYAWCLMTNHFHLLIRELDWKIVRASSQEKRVKRKVKSNGRKHYSLFTFHSSLWQRQPVRYSVEVCVKQVTRSGTSIAANVAEGQYAQSKDDLIAKYGIALKEASETKMWLDRLLNRKVIDEKNAQKVWLAT